MVGPDGLQLPYWLFSSDEIASVILGRQITVDTPLPYRPTDLHRLLDDAMGRPRQA